MFSDILVLVSELVVVAILSEWWLVPTTVGTSLLCTYVSCHNSQVCIYVQCIYTYVCTYVHMYSTTQFYFHT